MTNTPEPGRLGPVGQIAISVKSLNDGVAFYRDKLGLPLLFETPGMAFFDGGGTRILMGEAGEQGDYGVPLLYYRVSEIKTTLDAIRHRGVSVEREAAVEHSTADYDLWLAFVRDMDRNMVGLMEEVAKT